MIQAKKLSPFFSARYSDLLLSLEHSFIERFGLAGREGSFVCKTVKGRKYWYFQFMEEGKQKPVFIGPDSGGIRQAIQETKEAKEVIKQLALSLSSAGGFVFPGTAGRILSSMGGFRTLSVRSGHRWNQRFHVLSECIRYPMAGRILSDANNRY